MAAVDDLTTYITAARTAFAAADYDTARQQLTLADMTLVLIPNASSDGTGVNWRDTIDRLRTAVTAESGRGTSCVTVYSEFTGE